MPRRGGEGNQGETGGEEANVAHCLVVTNYLHQLFVKRGVDHERSRRIVAGVLQDHHGVPVCPVAMLIDLQLLESDVKNAVQV